MNQGFRGDGAGEYVDGDWPPPDERSVGDDDGDDLPLPEGSVPGRTAPREPQIGSAKVPPRGGGVSSESFLLIFFLGRKTSYSRRWAPEAYQGAHEAGGAPPTLMARVWAPSRGLFCQYFSYFPKIISVDFQVIPRTFVSTQR